MSVTLPTLKNAVVLAFGGHAGSGKTTIASIVAPFLGPLAPAKWLNTDAVRKELAGISWSTRLPAIYYTPEARAKIYKEIDLRASLTLNENRSIIWDASFGRPTERNLVKELAVRHAKPFLGLLFDAPLEMRCERARHRTANPSDADESYISNVERFESLTETEHGWFVINSSGLVEDTINLVVERIQCFANGDIDLRCDRPGA